MILGGNIVIAKVSILGAIEILGMSLEAVSINKHILSRVNNGRIVLSLFWVKTPQAEGSISSRIHEFPILELRIVNNTSLSMCNRSAGYVNVIIALISKPRWNWYSNN